MNKWIALISITGVLLLVDHYELVSLHVAFPLMVFFFAIQSFVLFRIDHWTPKEWSSQMALVKIVIRLLSSLIFITVIMYSHQDQFNLVVQFILLYLIYMIFEIANALTNLRRN